MKFIVAIPYVNSDGLLDVALYSEDRDTPAEAAHAVWSRVSADSQIGKGLKEVVTRVTAAKAGRLGDYFYKYTAP